MILDWLVGLGPWNWIVLGLVLLALEIAAPGAFLLWIGIAALLTGMASFQLAEAAWWGWQLQVVLFLVLSIAAVLVGKRVLASTHSDESDQPLLNRRAQQLVGRVSTLEEPIVNGRGRVRLGETMWLAKGPDMPAGAQVRIKSADDGVLTVEQA